MLNPYHVCPSKRNFSHQQHLKHSPPLEASLSMMQTAFPDYTQTYATAGVFDLETTIGGTLAAFSLNQ